MQHLQSRDSFDNCGLYKALSLWITDSWMHSQNSALNFAYIGYHIMRLIFQIRFLSSFLLSDACQRVPFWADAALLPKGKKRSLMHCQWHLPFFFFGWLHCWWILAGMCWSSTTRWQVLAVCRRQPIQIATPCRYSMGRVRLGLVRSCWRILAGNIQKFVIGKLSWNHP